MEDLVVDEQVGPVEHVSRARNLELGEVWALGHVRRVAVPGVARVYLVSRARVWLCRCLRPTSET